VPPNNQLENVLSSREFDVTGARTKHVELAARSPYAAPARRSAAPMRRRTARPPENARSRPAVDVAIGPRTALRGRADVHHARAIARPNAAETRC